MLGAAGLGAALEDFLGIVEELLLPRVNHRRMHAMQRRQLTDRLVTLHRCQRHLGLERRRVVLPFPWHDYPFRGQPIVAYSTVQFLGSTSRVYARVSGPQKLDSRDR